MVERVVFPAGHYLIKQGDVGSVFYMLEEGEVKILKDGTEVARLKRGAHFGEQALLKDQRRNADVVATTDVRVLSLSQRDFLSLSHKVRTHVEDVQHEREYLEQNDEDDVMVDVR